MAVARFIFRHLSPRVKNPLHPLNTKPRSILQIEKKYSYFSPESNSDLLTNIQSLYRLSYAGSSYETEFYVSKRILFSYNHRSNTIKDNTATVLVAAALRLSYEGEVRCSLP
jgi:hypothetical protein